MNTDATISFSKRPNGSLLLELHYPVGGLVQSTGCVVIAPEQPGQPVRTESYSYNIAVQNNDACLDLVRAVHELMRLQNAVALWLEYGSTTTLAGWFVIHAQRGVAVSPMQLFKAACDLERGFCRIDQLVTASS